MANSAVEIAHPLHVVQGTFEIAFPAGYDAEVLFCTEGGVHEVFWFSLKWKIPYSSYWCKGRGY